MNQQTSYDKLLRDVDDLKQIVCTQAVQIETLASFLWTSGNTDDEDQAWHLFDEFEAFRKAIALKLDPVIYCHHCCSRVQFKVDPETGLDGFGCKCPDRPLFDVSCVREITGALMDAAIATGWDLRFINGEN